MYFSWIIGKEFEYVKVNEGQSFISGHFKKTEKLPLLLMTIKRKDWFYVMKCPATEIGKAQERCPEGL